MLEKAQKIMPKVVHTKWILVLSFVVSIACIGKMVLVLIWVNPQEMKPCFVATPFQNNLIIVGCIVIFIASSLYTKTWFTVILPVFLAMGPTAERYIPKEVNGDPIYISHAL